MIGHTDAEIESIAREVAAAAGIGPVASLSRFEQGIANHVYRVNEGLVIRLGTADDGPQFPKSVAILRAIEGRVRAPRILFDDLSQARWPFNVMVYELVPGDALAAVWPGLDESERGRIVQEIGRELARLHELPIPAAPGLEAPEDWAPSFLESLEARLRLSREMKTLSPDRLDRLGLEIESHAESLRLAPPAVLVHNDVNLTNVIVNDGDVVALIDFDDAEVAPPEEDHWALARRLAEQGVPPATAVSWIEGVSPGHFGLPGLRGRCLLREVNEILWNATTHYSWDTAESGVAEANEQYRVLFEERLLDAWFPA